MRKIMPLKYLNHYFSIKNTSSSVTKSQPTHIDRYEQFS